MDEFTALENEYWHNLAVKIPKLLQDTKAALNAPMMRAKLGVFLSKLDGSPEVKELFDDLDNLSLRQIAVRRRLTGGGVFVLMYHCRQRAVSY